MKCPNCDHVSDASALVKCSHCGEAFERGLLEELGHLEYLQNWVDKYRADLGDKAQFIQSRVGEQQRKLLKEIKGLAEVPKAESVPIVRKEPPPTPKPVISEAKPAIEKPTPVLMKAQATSVSTPVPVSKPASVAPVAPKPRPVPPKPAAPPKPPRPPIDWRKVHRRSRHFRRAFAGAALSGRVHDRCLCNRAGHPVLGSISPDRSTAVHRLCTADLLLGRLGIENASQSHPGWDGTDRHWRASRRGGFWGDLPAWQDGTKQRLAILADRFRSFVPRCIHSLHGSCAESSLIISR